MLNSMSHSKCRLPQERCIIFVERVVTAKVLASFLSFIFESVQCHYVVGGMHSSSRKSLTDTVNKFRSGQVSLSLIRFQRAFFSGKYKKTFAECIYSNEYSAFAD